MRRRRQARTQFLRLQRRRLHSLAQCRCRGVQPVTGIWTHNCARTQARAEPPVVTTSLRRRLYPAGNMRIALQADAHANSGSPGGLSRAFTRARGRRRCLPAEGRTCDPQRYATCGYRSLRSEKTWTVCVWKKMDRGSSPMCGSGSILAGWKLNAEGRAPKVRLVQPERAPMLGDDRLDDGQSQT